MKMVQLGINKYRFFLLLFVVIISFGISFFLLREEEIISVDLIGSEQQYLPLNSNYIDPGFKIMINDRVVDEKEYNYTVDNDINVKVLGDYELVYHINYNDEEFVLKRNISVVDTTKPVINVSKNPVEIYYCDKESNINLEYTAVDDYDGVITDKVEEIRENDRIILSVSDSSGNLTEVAVEITYTNEVPPIIELVGNEVVYLKKGAEYVEQGAYASDGCGKSIDEDIKISHNVDVNVPGEYEVIYEVSSSTGKTAIKKRTVVVYEYNGSSTNPQQDDKVVYLTFDDGPGVYTEEILDILAKYNVKATFFVTNQFPKYIHLLSREAEEGHTVAVHTLTHKWSIYQSVETYMKDFNDMNDIVQKYTGKRTRLFRFPGGSSNTVSKKYASGVVSAISDRMTKDGYIYFDWNVDSEDAAGANKEQIYNNVISGMKSKKNSVVLMHDIKKYTAEALEDIINYGLANGYTFKALDEMSPTVHHPINN